MKKIKGSHVVVVGSGPSVKKYEDKITNFIDKNNVVIFGCNNINHILTPDYHFWGSTKRWNEFGHLVNKKSTLIVSKHFPESHIRKKWSGSYKTFNNVERLWKPGSEISGSKQSERCKVCYRKKKMFACVRNIATWAIFYAYIKGASKISVVGNDGYTLYSEGYYDKTGESQHCYGQGLTSGYSYGYCRRNDWFKYRTLKSLNKYGKKKHGFGFKFITPTVFDRFYDSTVLDIDGDPLWVKWKEPDTKEMKKIYAKKSFYAKR